MKKDISVIIPVHEVTGNFEEYFKRALQSLVNQVTQVNEVVLVYPNTKEVVSWVEEWEKDKPSELKFNLVKNEGK